MKKINEQFSSKGFDFRQIWREGIVCLYEKSKKGYEYKSFEVVILNENPPYQLNGNSCGDCESLPRNEQWGTKGFTYTDRESAEKKFKELTKNQK